jgi:hypothetical protein
VNAHEVNWAPNEPPPPASCFHASSKHQTGSMSASGTPFAST